MTRNANIVTLPDSEDLMRACVRLIITMCLVTTYAPAWGIKGHRLIAELAEKRLIARNPRVLKRIAGLLGPGVSLSSIAVCADSIRDYVRDRDKPGVVLPDNCLVTKQQAIEQFPTTGSWHFINIPLSSDSHFSAHPDSILEQACAANAPCVTTQ